MGEKETEFKIIGPKYIQQTLKEATDTKYKQKLSEQIWLGNYVTEPWKDITSLNTILTQSGMQWKNIPRTKSIHKHFTTTRPCKGL